MKKARLIPDPILMLVTILVVTGFQVYWLKDSYDREKRSLQIKSNVAFQDVVRDLQAVKLKLKDLALDTVHGEKMRVVVGKNLDESDFNVHGDFNVKMLPGTELVSTVNAMNGKFRDSIQKAGTGGNRLSGVNSTHRNPGTAMQDSAKGRIVSRNAFVTLKGSSKMIQFLYTVDSLQDSLRLNEITAAFLKKLKEQTISVPFKIVRQDSAKGDDEPGFSNVTVGFVHPVTYHLELGNTFPYLLQQIALPILFSVFLVGVTIVSFVLLYRNLLRQRRLAVLKNEFIANITHELKTPIATVGVAIEALKNFNAMHDPQRTKEYLDISSNELQRLGLLVDKVLKLSMFEKKEIDLKYETFDLRELVDEVVASMRLQIEKHGAMVSVTQSGDSVLEGDRLHLLSVVFNLLDNALKYSKSQPSIHISIEGEDTSIRLSTSDNGIGIAPEYKNRIFEKFFRVPTGDAHNAKGYGLGLSYVAQVVEKHRGTISVDTQVSKGTTITLTIPKKNA